MYEKALQGRCSAVLVLQTSLREAGSHLYRIAPVMMEMARAFSAAVAALQGDAGPLALSSSQYIRPDGEMHLEPPCIALEQPDIGKSVMESGDILFCKAHEAFVPCSAVKRATEHAAKHLATHPASHELLA